MFLFYFDCEVAITSMGKWYKTQCESDHLQHLIGQLAKSLHNFYSENCELTKESSCLIEKCVADNVDTWLVRSIYSNSSITDVIYHAWLQYRRIFWTVKQIFFFLEWVFHLEG